jgi:hypothetical protein
MRGMLGQNANTQFQSSSCPTSGCDRGPTRCPQAKTQFTGSSSCPTSGCDPVSALPSMAVTAVSILILPYIRMRRLERVSHMSAICGRVSILILPYIRMRPSQRCSFLHRWLLVFQSSSFPTSGCDEDGGLDSPAPAIRRCFNPHPSLHQDATRTASRTAGHARSTAVSILILPYIRMRRRCTLQNRARCRSRGFNPHPSLHQDATIVVGVTVIAHRVSILILPYIRIATTSVSILILPYIRMRRPSGCGWEDGFNPHPSLHQDATVPRTRPPR